MCRADINEGIERTSGCGPSRCPGWWHRGRRPCHEPLVFWRLWSRNLLACILLLALIGTRVGRLGGDEAVTLQGGWAPWSGDLARSEGRAGRLGLLCVPEAVGSGLRDPRHHFWTETWLHREPRYHKAQPPSHPEETEHRHISKQRHYQFSFHIDFHSCHTAQDSLTWAWLVCTGRDSRAGSFLRLIVRTEHIELLI